MSRCHGKGLALVILLTSMQLVSQQVFLLPMRFPAEVKLIEVENLALAGDFGNEYVGRMKETLGTISTHATLHTDDGVTWDSFMRESAASDVYFKRWRRHFHGCNCHTYLFRVQFLHLRFTASP